MNVIIFRDHHEYLRAKLIALLPDPAEGVSLIHKGERKKRDVDILANRSMGWNRGWDILYGPAETDAPPTPDESTLREKIGGIAFHQARCDYLTSRFTWAICEWPGTMHERLYAFVTADCHLAEHFLTITPNKVTLDGKVSLYGKYPQLISSYLGIERLDDSLNGAIFYDREHEGSFAWRLAEEEGVPPFLIIGPDPIFGPAPQEDWWRKYIVSLEPVIEGTVLFPGRPRKRRWLWPYIILRATDADAYHALWQSHRDVNSEAIARLTLSGRADGATVQAAVEKYLYFGRERDIEKLRRFSAITGWAYGHCVGGGGDEYSALFWSEDPAQTQRIFQWVTEAEPLHERQVERPQPERLGGGTKTVTYRPVYPYGRL